MDPAHWTGFHIFVGVLLFVDLVTWRPVALSFRAALLRTIVWIALGFGVNAWVYQNLGHSLGMDFLSAFLLEKSLSVDNLFVFLLLFRYFKVPPACQQRVLLFGVLGALLMRAALIWAGISLVARYHWILYIFAAILIYAGIKMGFSDDSEHEVDINQNCIVAWFRKRFSFHDQFVGEKFIVRIDGRTLFTPLAIVLVAVETTDLLFALDSIPAVFGVTQNTFIVYSSNVMAILGLRALFFVLAGLMGMFHYLQQGLSIILVFIGAEMLVHQYYPISTPVELGFIVSVLFLSVLLSWLKPKAQEPQQEVEVAREQRPEQGEEIVSPEELERETEG